MKKTIITGALICLGLQAFAQSYPDGQSPIDAYRLSQPDLKGTARYMSMAGAFGALGGDLSTLSHNPAGIGIYRNSEVGFTLDLDLQKSISNSNDYQTPISQTKFLLNNMGFVWTLKLSNPTFPNFNFGFTYNKSASFNRRYRGEIRLSNSLSNYIASVTTAGGYNESQLLGSSTEDPYNPSQGIGAPWLSILGYDGYLFSSYGQNPQTGNPLYVGQFGGNTKGTGYFDVEESGAVDSYNIAFGGNISNVVFWGMDFDIAHLNYVLRPQWTEHLTDAQVGNDAGMIDLMPASWTLSNYYRCTGTGFNFKLGLIVKPIQELRLGLSFETPTWYSFNESFDASINYLYGGRNQGVVYSNRGYTGVNNVNFRTPWKLNVSAAAVLFNKFILSGEYEWTQYKGMRYSSPSYWGGWAGGDYWYPDDYYPWDWYSATRAADPFVSSSPFSDTNDKINSYYCNTNTVRLGAEFRVTNRFSVRAGYSYVSAPVKDEMNSEMIKTAGMVPNYRFDNTTNYITCGLGYKIKAFTLDLAYVYKHMTSTYHAFSPYRPILADDMNADNLGVIQTQTSSLSLNNSQIVLSASFKF